MEWYLKVWKQYADFEGRARRTEYWMFRLFSFIFVAGLLILGLSLGDVAMGFMIAILLIYSLAVLIPGLAVTVRRLHDTGKSGTYIFILFIPLVGPIWFLILLFTEGDKGDNAYGPDPKAITV